MAIGLAFKVFFQVLFRKEVAARVAAALAAEPTKPAAIPEPSKPATPAAPKVTQPKLPARSDALTLLSTLQREARLLDLVGEQLDGFDDAQVGAAARQVIAEVRKSLDRMFAIKPLEDREEGDSIDIPRPLSPTRYHVSGRGADQATRGSLVHRGWKAERCQTPVWNGTSDDAMVLSPIEIEVDG